VRSQEYFMTAVETSKRVINRRGFIQLTATAAGVLLAACGGAVAPASSGPASSAPSSAAPKASVSVAPSASTGSTASASASAAAKPSASAAASTSPATLGNLRLPTYVPFNGPKPDLPGTADGVADAYFAYPKNLVKSVTTPPGKGGDVT